jgi:hypothetical protein
VTPNPLPGSPLYHPSRHGDPMVPPLLALLRALPGTDSAAALQAGRDVLERVRAAGAMQDVYDDVLDAIQGALAVMARPAPSAGAACDGVDAADAVDASDWYAPDAGLHYVLDGACGIALRALVEDLRVTDRYVARGARPPTRALFVGPPGCGKTMGARWLAGQLGVDCGILRVDATVGSTVGAIARRLRASFEAARDRGGVLALDEFEALAVPRTNTSANVGQWSRETTSALLQLLDSLPPEQIVIGATNYPTLVDPAVRDRMWTKIHFGPPSRDARAGMLKRWWARCPHDGEAKRVLLDLTEGYSGRTLEVAQDAANRAAARRSVAANVTEADVREAFVSAVVLAEEGA